MPNTPNIMRNVEISPENKSEVKQIGKFLDNFHEVDTTRNGRKTREWNTICLLRNEKPAQYSLLTFEIVFLYWNQYVQDKKLNKYFNC